MAEGDRSVVTNPLLKEASIEQLLDELMFRGEAFIGAIYQYSNGKKDPHAIWWRAVGPATLQMGMVHVLGRAAESNLKAEDEQEEAEAEDDSDEEESV